MRDLQIRPLTTPGVQVESLSPWVDLINVAVIGAPGDAILWGVDEVQNVVVRNTGGAAFRLRPPDYVDWAHLSRVSIEDAEIGIDIGLVDTAADDVVIRNVRSGVRTFDGDEVEGYIHLSRAFIEARTTDSDCGVDNGGNWGRLEDVIIVGFENGGFYHHEDIRTGNLARVRVENNGAYGIRGHSTWMTDVVVRMNRGPGIYADDVAVGVTRAYIANNVGPAMFGEFSSIFDVLAIDNSEGLLLYDFGDAERLVVSGYSGVGIRGGSGSLTDVLVERGVPDSEGNAIGISSTSAGIERAVVRDAIGVGVLGVDPIRDTFVDGVRVRSCAASTCSDAPGGYGVVPYDGSAPGPGRLVAERVAIRRAEVAGFVAFFDPEALNSRGERLFTFRGGELANNPIGVNVVGFPFDPATFMDGVVYRDNLTDIASLALPPP